MTPAGVRAWQRIVGVHTSKVDGKWGPQTDALARAWQAANGIEPDGVIGPLCRAAVAPGALTRAFEGCILQAYDDERRSPLSARLLHKVGGTWIRADGRMCVNTPTIGWGSTAPCRRGIERCTQVEADQWFADDFAATRLPTIRRYQGADWNAAMICAAASFCYNEGTGAFAKLAATGFAFDHWILYDVAHGVHDVGLRMRREEEIALFTGA